MTIQNTATNVDVEAEQMAELFNATYHGPSKAFGKIMFAGAYRDENGKTPSGGYPCTKCWYVDALGM